ncbi:MAG: cytochrome c, partial [Ekhidna sp.]|nr:cytochrome c [Ekhidna sp.]
NQMMPGNPITNLEIAEVLTFITNAWGNEGGLIGVKDVDKWLEECKE